MKYKLPSIIFIALISISAFIAYMSGYDFNYRDADVGFFTAISLFIAIGVSVAVYAHAEL